MSSQEQPDGPTPARASLDKRPAEIAAMFDGVAQRYDRTNMVLSLGMDRGWRKATRDALDLRAGELVLDLAAGTAVSTEELGTSGAQVIGVDLSIGMLEVARRERPTATLAAGDAMALPFADGTFDATTIAFGLRNIADTVGALRELARVTKPGGRLVICEFSHPTWKPFNLVYRQYLRWGLPTVAKRISSNPGAYTYLAESVTHWPDQAKLASLLLEAGWKKVAWRNLTGGVVTMHRAIRP